MFQHNNSGCLRDVIDIFDRYFQFCRVNGIDSGIRTFTLTQLHDLDILTLLHLHKCAFMNQVSLRLVGSAVHLSPFLVGGASMRGSSLCLDPLATHDILAPGTKINSQLLLIAGVTRGATDFLVGSLADPYTRTLFWSLVEDVAADLFIGEHRQILAKLVLIDQWDEATEVSTYLSIKEAVLDLLISSGISPLITDAVFRAMPAQESALFERTSQEWIRRLASELGYSKDISADASELFDYIDSVISGSVGMLGKVVDDETFSPPITHNHQRAICMTKEDFLNSIQDVPHLSLTIGSKPGAFNPLNPEVVGLLHSILADNTHHVISLYLDETTKRAVSYFHLFIN
jgi:hypothetical protein